MNAALRRRAKTLFHEALERPAGERTSFVKRAAGSDLELETAVVELLEAHAQAGEFLGRPTLGALAGAASSEERAGERIGPYELLEPLGEGGFGVVWRARQHEPVRREVALKVIKLGMDTRAVVARFEAERQALALMDHPGIARVFDAGATAAGRPYFVMELVRGVPITRFCDQEHLKTRERLVLFARVCRAVQHAHQKGVIHRDLKPGNVLVARHDGEPLPKVIDFGVAKATSARLAEHSLHTAERSVVGTPDYMAPEQARGNGADIDTRADVYALGVLLYELLTGRRPFDFGADTGASWEDVVRAIREVEPRRPSTRVSTLDAETRAAVMRSRATHGLIEELAGDLDWIAMKALEKDRERRYDTALALAEDVERHLAHEPVLARPPSAAYRFAKLVRRNRLAFVAGALVLATLVAGIVATWLALVEARAQRDRARVELASRQRFAQFMKDMLRGAGPAVAQGRDATILREILGRTRERVDVELADDPLVRAGILGAIGETHADIGDFDAAIADFSEALRITRASAPDDLKEIAIAEGNLAQALVRRGRVDEAEAHARECRRLLPGLVVLEPHDRAMLHNSLGLVDMARGRYAEAEAEFWTALTLESELGIADSEPGLTALSNLAEVLRAGGRLADAERVYAGAIERSTRSLGPDHPLTLGARGGRAVCWVDARRSAEARVELEAILEQARRVHGPRSFVVGLGLQNLAHVEHRLGNDARAEELYDEEIALFRALTPRDWSATAQALVRRAKAQIALGKGDAARASLDEGLAMYERLGEMRGTDWAEGLVDRATLHEEQGELDLAESDLRRAIEVASAIDPRSRQTAVLHNQLGAVLFAQGRPADALAEVTTAYELARALPGFDPLDLGTTANNLTRMRVASGQFDAAVESGREAVRLRREHGEKPELVGDATHWLAQALWRSGARDEAWTVFVEHHELVLAAAGHDEAARTVALRNAALRSYGFAHYEWARERCQELVASVRVARNPDFAAWGSAIGTLSAVDTVLGRPEAAVTGLREYVAALEGSLADEIALSGVHQVLAAQLVDVAGAHDDPAAAREAVTLMEAVLSVREKLLIEGDWRLPLTRSIACAARCEVTRIAADAPDPATRRTVLAKALAELAPLVDAALAAGVPRTVRPYRLPTPLLALARLHDALAALDPDAGHAEAAREARTRADAVRLEPQE